MPRSQIKYLGVGHTTGVVPQISFVERFIQSAFSSRSLAARWLLATTQSLSIVR